MQSKNLRYIKLVTKVKRRIERKSEFKTPNGSPRRKTLLVSGRSGNPKFEVYQPVAGTKSEFPLG
jgi:hypothetical protein